MPPEIFPGGISIFTNDFRQVRVFSLMDIKLRRGRDDGGLLQMFCVLFLFPISMYYFCTNCERFREVP